MGLLLTRQMLSSVRRFPRRLPTDTVKYSGFLNRCGHVVPHFFRACQNHRSGITHCLAPESKGLNFRFADHSKVGQTSQYKGGQSGVLRSTNRRWRYHDLDKSGRHVVDEA